MKESDAAQNQKKKKEFDANPNGSKKMAQVIAKRRENSEKNFGWKSDLDLSEILLNGNFIIFSVFFSPHRSFAN